MPYIRAKKHAVAGGSTLATALMLSFTGQAMAQDAGKLAEVEVKGSALSTELIAE